MKVDTKVIAVASAGLLALWYVLERFRATSHGDNPWTLDGFLGAALIMIHVERVAELTGASWASVFRNPAVQAALYDSKRKNPEQWAVVEASAKKAGMSTEDYVAKLSTGSRHVRGLAADFNKPGVSTATLAHDIFTLAGLGQVGRVKKVLDERDHAHVEWLAPWEPDRAPVLEGV